MRDMTGSSDSKNHKIPKNKRRSTVVFFVLIILIAGFTGWYLWNDKDKTVNDAYMAEPQYVEINEKYSDTLIRDGESAIESLNDVAGLIGITDSGKEFKVKSETEFGNCDYYRLDQMYEGIPVYGRNMVVVADSSNEAVCLTGNYAQIGGLSTEPRYSGEDALNAAADYMNSAYHCSGENIYLGEPELAVDSIYEEQAVLAYIVNLMGCNDDDESFSLELFINAETLEVYHENESAADVQKTLDGVPGQNGDQIITVEEGTSSYSLVNRQYEASTGAVIRVYEPDSEFTWYIDGNSTIANAANTGDLNPSAVDAMANVSVTLEYYYRVLNRRSFDNNGEDVHVYVNIQGYLSSYTNKESVYVDNASFLIAPDGKNILMFTKRSNESAEYSANLDVVAHEFTHGVAAGEVGFINSLVPNTLDEAYADILGECVEDSLQGFQTDWSMAASIRDLKDPHNTLTNSGNTFPVNMSEYDGTTTDCHYNATIIGHTAYLMWSGGDDTDNWAPIQDTETLAKLWYGSLLLLHSDADFSQCRNAVELSARIMLQSNDLTPDQYETVKKAFDRAGIKNAEYIFSEFTTNPFKLSIISSVNNVEEMNYNLQVYRILNTDSADSQGVSESTMESVEGITWKQASGLEYESTLILDKNCTEGTQEVSLPTSGIYTITVTDLDDSSKQPITVRTYVNAGNKDAVNYVEIKTDFGRAIQESDSVENAENLDSQAIFNEYIQNVLIPKHGIIKLNHFSYEIPYTDFEGNTTNLPPDTIYGLISTSIYDFDNDGQDELLAAVYDDHLLTLVMYEIENSEVIEKSFVNERELFGYDNESLNTAYYMQLDYTVYYKQQADDCLIFTERFSKVDAPSFFITALKYDNNAFIKIADLNFSLQGTTIEHMGYYYSKKLPEEWASYNNDDMEVYDNANDLTFDYIKLELEEQNTTCIFALTEETIYNTYYQNPLEVVPAFFALFEIDRSNQEYEYYAEDSSVTKFMEMHLSYGSPKNLVWVDFSDLHNINNIIADYWYSQGNADSFQYQTTFNPDGTVIMEGYRNKDTGYYEIEDEKTAVAYFTENYWDLPEEGFRLIEDYSFSVVYTYDVSDGSLYAECSKEFEDAAISEFSGGKLYTASN